MELYLVYLIISALVAAYSVHQKQWGIATFFLLVFLFFLISAALPTFLVR